MPLEQLVHSLIGRENLDGLHVGVELEYEGWEYDEDAYDDRGEWTLEGDPSLRNGGIEFVSIPLKETELQEALEYPERLIVDAGIQSTPRCGVHVHLNVKPFTVGQLWSLSCLYTLLEPTIFKVWCPDRELNHFCVPSFCNTMLQNQLHEDILQIRGGVVAPPRQYEQEEGYVDLEADDGEGDRGRLHRMLRGHARRGDRQIRILGSSKYCAMSFYRLHDLGTVEMRQLEGTTDMNRVYEWTRFLCRLWHYAAMYQEPLDLLKEYHETGLTELCNAVGLDTLQVDPLDQAEAIEAAIIMAGYNVPDWRDLEWKLED